MTVSSGSGAEEAGQVQNLQTAVSYVSDIIYIYIYLFLWRKHIFLNIFIHSTGFLFSISSFTQTPWCRPRQLQALTEILNIWSRHRYHYTLSVDVITHFCKYIHSFLCFHLFIKAQFLSEFPAEDAVGCEWCSLPGYRMMSLPVINGGCWESVWVFKHCAAPSARKNSHHFPSLPVFLLLIFISIMFTHTAHLQEVPLIRGFQEKKPSRLPDAVFLGLQ